MRIFSPGQGALANHSLEKVGLSLVHTAVNGRFNGGR